MKCGKCHRGDVDIEHVRKCHAQPNFPVTGASAPAIVSQNPAKPSLYDFTSIPAGRYALEIEGIVRFFQVDQPTEGKWAGWTFLKRLHGSPGDYNKERIKGREAWSLLRTISENPQEAMERFGHESGHCGKCGAALTDPESLSRGIGPVCIKTMGWAA